jgi:hypothetical protein
MTTTRVTIDAPRDVYLWSNGSVMVFDHNGRQMVNLQGRFNDVRDRVLAAATDHTRFHIGSWTGGASRDVSRDEWAQGDLS